MVFGMGRYIFIDGTSTCSDLGILEITRGFFPGFFSDGVQVFHTWEDIFQAGTNIKIPNIWRNFREFLFVFKLSLECPLHLQFTLYFRTLHIVCSTWLTCRQPCVTEWYQRKRSKGQHCFSSWVCWVVLNLLSYSILLLLYCIWLQHICTFAFRLYSLLYFVTDGLSPVVFDSIFLAMPSFLSSLFRFIFLFWRYSVGDMYL